MDRICEIVVIPDVVADGDALAAARAYAAVSGVEWRVAKRIGSTMSEDLGSIPQIPSGAQNFPNRAIRSTSAATATANRQLTPSVQPSWEAPGMPIDDDGYFSGDFSITWNAAAEPDLINLGRIGKTESDLYDIKIEASGLGQMRAKSNRTVTYSSPAAWTNVRINDLHA